MLRIFDYIYFKVTDYYKNNAKGDEYFLMGIVIVSIIQMLNLLTVLLASSIFITCIKNAISIESLEKTKSFQYLL